jgi:putative ABC transport system substrate-binding protein
MTWRASRRDALRLAIGALAMSAGRALAQTRQIRIAHLSWFRTHRGALLAEKLRAIGYDAGRNVEISDFVADGDPGRAAELAAGIVGSGVDLIVTSATPAALAAKRATTTIPIVAMLADPLASGVVSNLSRPGGNVTGFSTASTDLAPKRIELAREIMPSMASMAFLGSSRDPNGRVFGERTVAAGRQLGIDVPTVFIADPGEIEGAIGRARATGAQALTVQPLFVDEALRIVEAARPLGLPVFSDQREFAVAGAIVALGTDNDAQTTGVADYIRRILDGADPGELPFQQVDRHVLVINRRSATSLGLAIPPSVLIRADEVIE